MAVAFFSTGEPTSGRPCNFVAQRVSDFYIPGVELNSPSIRQFTSRFALLGLLAVVLALPYAVPPLGEWLLGRQPGQWIYLVKPVENQWAFLPVAVFSVAIPFLLLRAWAPPARVPRGTLALVLVLLVGAQGLSVFAAPSFDASVRAWLFSFAGLTVFGVLWLAELDRRGMEKLMLAAVMAGIPAALYAIAQSRGWEFLPYRQIHSSTSLLAEDTAAKQRISSTFGHPNYMASYLTPIVFWALYFVLTPGARLRRVVGAAGFFIFIITLVLAGTRGAWLAVIASGVAYYISLALTPAFRRQLLFTGGMAFLLGAALVVIPNPFLRINFDFRDRLFASKEITSRLYYWAVAGTMFQDRPLLGVGHGAFDPLYFEYSRQLQSRPEGREYEFLLRDNPRMTRAGFVHNDHLQTIAEGGVLCGVFWIALWTTFLMQCAEAIRWTRRRAEVMVLPATVLASGLAMGIDGVFGFPFRIPVSGCFFWVLLGCWTAWRGFSRHEPLSESNNRRPVQ